MMLRQQSEARADSGVQALLAEIMAYPMPPDSPAVDRDEGAQRYATPLRIATGAGVVSFLSTITIFGTPTDVTVSELALEMLFPADAETIEIVGTLNAAEGVPQRRRDMFVRPS